MEKEMTETQGPRKLPIEEIRQALTDARAAEAEGSRLQEAYIRYIVLANAGGIAACLGAANAILAAKGPISFVDHPLGCFLTGMISGGLLSSIRSKQAQKLADERARTAHSLIKRAGHQMPDPPPSFSKLEERGLAVANLAVVVLGLVGQFAFIAGAIWGLVLISRVP